MLIISEVITPIVGNFPAFFHGAETHTILRQEESEKSTETEIEREKLAFDLDRFVVPKLSLY